LSCFHDPVTQQGFMQIPRFTGTAVIVADFHGPAARRAFSEVQESLSQPDGLEMLSLRAYHPWRGHVGDTFYYAHTAAAAEELIQALPLPIARSVIPVEASSLQDAFERYAELALSAQLAFHYATDLQAGFKALDERKDSPESSE
jgi:hypothetical protein